MFGIRIAIDEKQIVDVWLINTGHKDGEGKHLYRIRKPKELNSYEIYHDQSKPWFFLVEEAMKVLKAHWHGIPFEDDTVVP